MLESLFNNKVAGMKACKETPIWRRSGVFIINFVLHLVLVFLLQALNMQPLNMYDWVSVLKEMEWEDILIIKFFCLK